MAGSGVRGEDGGIGPAAEEACCAVFGIQGALRRFTVYGDGEQTTSASMNVGAPGGSVASAPAPAVAPTEGSAAQATAAVAARAGVGSRLSRGALSASGSSRNVR